MICVVALAIILLVIFPLDPIVDVVDMEVHAIAKACKQANVNFRCFKYVSDPADENASDEWQKTVANGEQEYIKIFNKL